MWNKTKDKLKNKYKKRGINSLTLVVGVLIAFISVSALYDVTALQTKFSTLSSQTGYVSRVVARQGGVSTEEPPNYHGRYVTSSELYSNIRSAMSNAGFDNGDYTVVVAGHPLTPATQTPLFDYGERIPVSIHIDYEWSFVTQFFPNEMKNDRTSSVEVVSTYNIRDGGFSENTF